MAFLETHLFSEALNVAVTVNVLLPEPSQGIGLDGTQAQQPPRAMYLLHGYSDDHSIWMRRTSVERYCAKRNLAVFMPAVNHSFYANEVHGERYWDYVSQELPQMMHRMFRLDETPGSELVAGLSMGGYGAMKLALTYPERFAAAASFSGAVDVEALLRKRDPMLRNAMGSAQSFHDSEGDLFHLMAQNAQAARKPRLFVACGLLRKRDPMLRNAMGSAQSFHDSEGDLFHLMAQNAQAARKPRLFVACGQEDFLYQQHQKFIPELIRNGWDVTHEETPGYGHSWEYWDQKIAQFLTFALAD